MSLCDSDEGRQGRTFPGPTFYRREGRGQRSCWIAQGQTYSPLSEVYP